MSPRHNDGSATEAASEARVRGVAFKDDNAEVVADNAIEPAVKHAKAIIIIKAFIFVSTLSKATFTYFSYLILLALTQHFTW